MPVDGERGIIPISPNAAEVLLRLWGDMHTTLRMSQNCEQRHTHQKKSNTLQHRLPADDFEQSAPSDGY